MASLTIIIQDSGDEVTVACEGDTTIIDKATPAQVLANKLMETAGKELGQIEG